MGNSLLDDASSYVRLATEHVATKWRHVKKHFQLDSVSQFKPSNS